MFKNKRDYILLIPTCILLIYLILRFVDRSFIMWIFPLDISNDISSHMARLFFLAKYGFHSIVPNWYAGFDYVLFRSYPPGWYFFTLPLYYLFGNAQIATYVSIVLIYILSFLAILWIGRNSQFSFLRSIFYFLLIYATPVSIGYFLRLGKVSEITGWMFALFAFMLLLYYKDHKIDWKFYFLGFLLGGWLISNLVSFMAFFPLFLGYLLIKTNRERIALFVTGMIGLILSSFWFIPFLKHTLTNGSATAFPFAKWLLNHSLTVDQITSWVSSSFFLIVFYFYLKSQNFDKKEILFFGPTALFAVLVFSRIVAFVPIFNYIYPDSFTMLFLVVGGYLFLSTKFPFKWNKIIGVLLVLIVAMGTFISFSYTQGESPHTQLYKDTLELMPLADTLMIGPHDKIYSKSFYSYGALYFDTKAIGGWYDQDIPWETREKMYQFHFPKSESDCNVFLEDLYYFKIRSLIVYDTSCPLMQKCGLTFSQSKNNVCLYHV